MEPSLQQQIVTVFGYPCEACSPISAHLDEQGNKCERGRLSIINSNGDGYCTVCGLVIVREQQRVFDLVY